MKVTLQILTGPETGRKIHLKSGQLARFGRTEWSDFAFPYDDQMAEVHFSVETKSNAVLLVDLSEGSGLQVDGKSVTNGSLKTGQKVKAGNMVFAITNETPFDTLGAGAIAETQQTITARPIAELASKVCNVADLSETAQTLCDETVEVIPFLHRLCERELFPDALSVLATWLGKRKGVWWAVDCVESACSDRLQSQADLLESTRKWVLEPTEDNRRSVADAADSTDSTLPACWVARAAGWSGGSLTPPELPVVPPAEHLTKQGILAGLSLAAPFISPAKTLENYRQFIELGEQLSQTKFDWEKDDNGQ
jgi:hypothetical protein